MPGSVTQRSRNRPVLPSARSERHSHARAAVWSMRMQSWRRTMPHVDEGVLHAYLDGALDALHEGGALPDAMTPADVISHLDACADCRARLNIERDIRQR